MYLVIPWLTHGYALRLKINTSGSFSPVSAISPGRKVFLPHGRGESQPCLQGWSTMPYTQSYITILTKY